MINTKTKFLNLQNLNSRRILQKGIVLVSMFLLVVWVVIAADHECYDIATDGCGDIDSSGDVFLYGDITAEFFNVTSIIYANTFTLSSLIDFPTNLDINITNNLADFKVDLTVNGALVVNNALSAGSMSVVGDFVASRLIGFLNLEDACDDASNRVVGSVTGVSFIFKDNSPSC